MRPIPLSVLLASLALSTGLFAQTPASEQGSFDPLGLAAKNFNSFEKGDGILSLSLGAVFPLGFYHPATSAFMAPNAAPGFSFSLAYAGFLSPEWALEGELAGGFIRTKSEASLFLAPISLRASRYFPLGAFAIAPSVGLGAAISSLGDEKHVDGLFKFGSTFMWKASQDMSYSLKLFGNVIPQFYTNPELNMVGFFLESTLSVAYHL